MNVKPAASETASVGTSASDPRSVATAAKGKKGKVAEALFEGELTVNA